MALRVKTSIPQNLNFTLISSILQSPEQRSKVFANFAAQIIEDAKAQNASILGSVPPYSVSVDGRLGAPLESVNPDGTVVVEFELVFEAISLIGDLLRQHSPVKTGRYQQSHVLIADNVAVPDGAIPPIAKRYEWVNIQPYSRKIERGLSSQAPDGVYQAIANLPEVKRRLGNIAKIQFGYTVPLFGAIGEWANTPSAAALARKRRGGRPDRHGEWLRRQPAIIITL